jgi:hypothetical protein
MTIPPEFDDQPHKLTDDDAIQPDDTPLFEDDSDGDDEVYEPIEPRHEIIEAPLREFETQPELVNFEELTLAQVFGRFLIAPITTWRLLTQVAQTPPEAPPADIPVEAMPEDETGVVIAKQVAKISLAGISLAVPRLQEASGIGVSLIELTEPQEYRQAKPLTRTAFQLGLYLTAFLFAWWGSSILVYAPVRIESEALDKGAPLLIIAFLLWLGAEVYGNWSGVKSWWSRITGKANPEEPTPEVRKDVYYPDTPTLWTGIHPIRVFALLGGLFFSFLAWRNTRDNLFTTIGFYSWIASAVLWSSALTTADWTPIKFIQSIVTPIRQIRWRGNWTLWCLLVIMLVGAYFRFNALDRMPPEMTSDHVEKLLDSQRVLTGTTQVFFPNNGGREPFQMYAMAVFSQLPGMSMNFTSLKILSVLEGLVTLPVLWCMGREVIGERDRRLGNLVGLTLAALVAVSYWHVALSRLALRIVLTPLVTSLLIIFLTRALRHNRRNDFIAAGLVLGFGLYTYQAVRMLPVVIVVGVVMAVIMRGRSWQELSRYVVNLSVLVLISFVAFVPMLGFAAQYPEDFWRRSSGRLLGDDVIQSTDAQGNIVYRNATFQERVDAFIVNLPALANNVRNALLMFNWKGDVAWINAAPNYPAMDTFTGALLIIGLAAWLARMVRHRDVVDWLMPVMLVIMLFPSALSIAYPVENPSATRMSGTLPEVNLFAALPLAMMVASIKDLTPGKIGAFFGGGLAVFVILIAYLQNANTYFDQYYHAYLDSALPYKQAGKILRGFADSDGSYANAFMIAYPYWWDHRAVGLEAGLVDWPNGILKASDVPSFLFSASQRINWYTLDSDKDLLFYYSIEDKEADQLLKEWFPEGRARLEQSDHNEPAEDFMTYRVPAMGMDKFMQWVTEFE